MCGRTDEAISVMSEIIGRRDIIMRKNVFILEEHINDEYETDFWMDGYTHLRAFHACRPLRIEDYFKRELCRYPIILHYKMLKTE